MGAEQNRRHGRRSDGVVAAALASGATLAQAASRGNVSERTVRRRLDNPDFAALVERLTVRVMEEVFDSLTAAARLACITLVELLDESVPPATRHAASRTILDQLTRFHDAVELEHRVRILESGIAREPDMPSYAA
jgi:hypothetical protein